jgi:hypothetical protein
MRKYLLLLISILLCLVTLYLINVINPYYVLQENIKSYRFGGESKPGDDRGAVSGIGIFRD